MNISHEQFGDEELIRSIQNALKKWKCVEASYKYCEENLDINSEVICTIEKLKQDYLSLLMEIRKRDLSLTKEQLLDTILFSYSSEEE